jgi:hypothetical protein
MMQLGMNEVEREDAGESVAAETLHTSWTHPVWKSGAEKQRDGRRYRKGTIPEKGL